MDFYFVNYIINYNEQRIFRRKSRIKKALVECPSPEYVDKYTKNVLKELYELHKNYVKQRMG